MCLRIWLVFLIFHFLISGTGAVCDTSAPLLSEVDKALISEYYNVKSILGDKVWPGYRGEIIPINLIAENYEYLFGYPHKPEVFRRLNTASISGLPVYYRKLKKQGYAIAATRKVDSINCIWVSSYDLYNAHRNHPEFIAHLFHEGFHVYQNNHFYNKEFFKKMNYSYKDSPINFPYPLDDFWDSEFLNLEGVHLAHAYEIPEEYTPRNDEEKEEIKQLALTQLRYFLKIRKLRFKLLQHKSEDYEKFTVDKEWQEGVAVYTEAKLMLEIEKSGYSPLKRALVSIPSFKYPPYKAFVKKRIIDNLYYSGFHTSDLNPIVWYHSYFIGAMQCLLLDELRPEWKDEYFSFGRWLHIILAQAIEKQ